MTSASSERLDLIRRQCPPGVIRGVAKESKEVDKLSCPTFTPAHFLRSSSRQHRQEAAQPRSQDAQLCRGIVMERCDVAMPLFHPRGPGACEPNDEGPAAMLRRWLYAPPNSVTTFFRRARVIGRVTLCAQNPSERLGRSTRARLRHSILLLLIVGGRQECTEVWTVNIRALGMARQRVQGGYEKCRLP